MASFTERISVIIDVSTEKALGGLRQFKTAVGEADGFTAKLKAGVGSLKSTFLTGAGATAAMAAGVGLAAKVTADAVSAYADLGVQVGNFAEATGLATEDASRWIEVAGDLGVSAESLQGVFGKLEKSISPKLFDDLGVAIARTSRGNVDANQTFLNVLDRLREIEDPAQRAQTAAKLLGKGWQDVAPLIGQSADDIKSRLADVADVKVFDSGKVEQSKQFRDSFNDLKDAGEEFALTLGETVIPEVTALAKAAIFVVRQLEDMKDALLPSAGAAKDAKQREQVNDLYKEYGSILFKTKAAQDADITSLSDLKSETAFASDESRKLIAAIEDQAAAFVAAAAELAAHASNSDNSARLAGLLADQQKRVADHTYIAKDSLDQARTALKKYQDQIKGRNDLIDLVTEFDDISTKLNGITMLHAANEISDRDYWLQSAQLVGDAQVAVSDYLDTLDELPPTVKTKLLAEFDPNAPQKFLEALQAELDHRKVKIGVVPRYVTGPQDGPNTGPRNTTPSTSTTTPKDGPNTHPGNTKGESASGFGRNTSGPVNITVNVPPGANMVDIGRATADALAAFYRSGGERP